MDPGAAADGSAAPEPASPAPGRAWVLLPVAWSVWLLVWLVPSLLFAPHLESPRLWMTRDTAPAAVAAAAALFLVAAWPFWPALAGGAEPLRGRWLALSALEGTVLAALAAPFALVAWSVAGRPLDVWPPAAVGLGLGVLGLGLRVAVAGFGPRAARWLMLAAMLACALPPALAYAGGETMGIAFPRLLEASPVVALVRAALEGWPPLGWPEIARLWLWPGVGVTLGAAGWLEWRRRGWPAAES